MKKRIILITVILSFLVSAIFYGIYINQKKKDADEKRRLEDLYYAQNTAFGLCCDNKRNYYHGTKDANMDDVTIAIYAYNNAQSEHKLTLNEFIAYINEEYDSEGTPMIYSQPPNIKYYVEWYWTIGQGENMIREYRTSFIYYLAKKNKQPYWEMNYEEVIANLEEFQKDPEYNPFLEE